LTKNKSPDKKKEKDYVDDMKAFIERKNAENLVFQKILTRLTKQNEALKSNFSVTKNKK
jgi:hypothetical protein